MGSDKYTIVYQAREMDMTDGGVYTEYLMSEDATVDDLPTDCRYSSLAYNPYSNKIYMFCMGGTWLEPGTSGVEIVPWSTGTDEQIAAMVAALDAGKITIADTGWQIGDEREVTLAAIDGGDEFESQPEQTVTLVLMDSQHYDLTTPTAGGDTKDHFVVGLKEVLYEYGVMDSNSNVTWGTCFRRTWCNGAFRNAVPETLRACFKQFQVPSCDTPDYSSYETTDDYFALFAAKEVFGSLLPEGIEDELSQIAYYETQENWIKSDGYDNAPWWLRTIFSEGGADGFICVNSDGDTGASTPDVDKGISPFGCI